MNQEIEELKRLRNDAIERGMQELAIVYGWSAIRLGQELLQRQLTQIELYRLAR